MPAIGTTSATMGTNGQPQVTVEQQLDQQFLKVMNDVNELWMSRQEFVNRFMDPRRNSDRECGYPHLSEYTPRRYRDIYNRDPIACRVVEIMPTECWKIQPSIAETSDEDNATK